MARAKTKKSATKAGQAKRPRSARPRRRAAPRSARKRASGERPRRHARRAAASPAMRALAQRIIDVTLADDDEAHPRALRRRHRVERGGTAAHGRDRRAPRQVRRLAQHDHRHELRAAAGRRRRQRHRDRVGRARDARRLGPTGRAARGRRPRDPRTARSRARRSSTIRRRSPAMPVAARRDARGERRHLRRRGTPTMPTPSRRSSPRTPCCARPAGRTRSAGARRSASVPPLLLRGFSDFRLERLALVIDGDAHADRWIMTGTHDGELFGIPPTGRPGRASKARRSRASARTGLVVEDVHFTDLAGLLAQLGLA